MSEIDRLTPTQRPAGRAAGYHVWSDLLFIHWRVPVSLLQPLLPPELTGDTFDGTAWVGLVPFQMSDVRPWWSIPVWGLSRFPETNVRTYVHYQGKDPGVWFFSLDASNWLAVQLARRGWGLNYQWANMRIERQGARRTYHSHRKAGHGSCHADIEVGAPYSQGRAFEQTQIAEPGTLDHFLVERYLLYAKRNGVLYQGQVHHRPYPLHVAKVLHLDQQLLMANGIEPPEAACHTLYSPGVKVEVFPLKAIARESAPGSLPVLSKNS